MDDDLRLIASASAYTALAEAIMETFSRHDAGQGLDPRPAPRLATSGEHPPMTIGHEQERHNENGADRNFVRQLQRIVGRVRFGWSVGATVLSPIFLLAALLIHNGWIATPAKDADMKLAQAKLANFETAQSVQGEALKSLNISVIRLEDSVRAQQVILDKIDNKLDSIMDQELAIMRAFTMPPSEQKASAPISPPPAPFHHPRPRAKKQESGLSLFR